MITGCIANMQQFRALLKNYLISFSVIDISKLLPKYKKTDWKHLITIFLLLFLKLNIVLIFSITILNGIMLFLTKYFQLTKLITFIITSLMFLAQEDQHWSANICKNLYFKKQFQKACKLHSSVNVSAACQVCHSH